MPWNNPADPTNPVPEKMAKSSFATWYDNACPAGGTVGCSLGQQAGDCSGFQASYQQALANSANDPHETVDFDAYHQTALAQGRLLNVEDSYWPVNAQCNTKEDDYWHTHCTGTVYFHLDGSEDPARSSSNCNVDANRNPTSPKNNGTGPNNPGAWSLVQPGDTDGTSSSVYQAPKVYNFQTYYATTSSVLIKGYQIATNHCDSGDFKALDPDHASSGKNDDRVIDSGDSTQYYSASAVSPVVNSASGAPLPYTWGNPGQIAYVAPDGTGAAFFDRICYYAGQKADPTNNQPDASAPIPNFTFFRDGDPHLLAASGSAVTPYFTPNVAGDKRTYTTSTVTGYTVNKSVQTVPPSWTLSWQHYEQTGSHQVTSNGAYHYTGTYKDTWSCTIAKGKSACTYAGGSCDHSASGVPGSGNWDSYSNLGGTSEYRNGNTCIIRSYTTTGGYYDQVTNTVPDYGWVNHSYGYSDQATAQSDLATCQRDSSSRNCSLVDNEQWSTPAQVTVAACPADTATERYTNCQPVVKNSTTTTTINVVHYNNENPVATILTRDPDGTPNKVNTDTGEPWSNLYTTNTATGDKNEAFSGGTDPGTTDSSGNVTPYLSLVQFAGLNKFQSKDVALIPGGDRQVEGSSIWASDQAAPQDVTLSWLFQPQVDNQAPVTNVGFGGAGGARTWNVGKVTTGVIGRVFANNDSTDAPSTAAGTVAKFQNLQWSTSGTGNADKWDVPLYFGSDKRVGTYTDPSGSTQSSGNLWNQSPSKFSPFYWVIDYVRTVSE